MQLQGSGVQAQSGREASTREKRGWATERVWHSGSRSGGCFRTGKVQSVELSVQVGQPLCVTRSVPHRALSPPFILFY